MLASMREKIATATEGTAIVANDRLADWPPRFPESCRATDAAAELDIILYNGNVKLTRKAADVYGARWVDEETHDRDRVIAKDTTFREDDSFDCVGDAICFAYRAGAVTVPRGRIFDHARQDYSRKAALRMKQ